jgi:hypothetical protein
MPNEFAVRMWGMTRMGARVIVARNGVMPVEIDNARLALLKKPADTAADPAKPQTNGALEPTRTADATGALAELRGTKTAEGSTQVPAAPTGPVSEAVKPAPVADRWPAETEGAMAGKNASDAKPVPAEAPKAAEAKEPAEPAKPAAEAPKASADVTPPAGELGAIPQTPGAALSPEKPLRSGPVSIFVSRREGKVFVRKGFEPIFDMPITIANKGQPLGTHVFTAMDYLDDGESFRWTAVTLPGEPPKPEHSAKSDKDGKKAKHKVHEERPARQLDVKPPQTAREALDRIEIAQDVRDRISELMIPGSSLIISDSGLGPETGKYTEFIVLTR